MAKALDKHSDTQMMSKQASKQASKQGETVFLLETA